MYKSIWFIRAIGIRMLNLKPMGLYLGGLIIGGIFASRMCVFFVFFFWGGGAYLWNFTVSGVRSDA